MPHVVILGPVTAERVHRELAPFDERDEVALYRLRESFLARSGNLVLLEILVVEGPATTRRGLLAAEGRGEALTLRIHPLADLPRTAAVKRAIGRIALRIRALDPDALRFGPTNLEAELRELGAPLP